MLYIAIKIRCRAKKSFQIADFASYRNKNGLYRNKIRFRSKISLLIDKLTSDCCRSQENIRLISKENIAWDSGFRFKLNSNLLQIGKIHFRSQEKFTSYRYKNYLQIERFALDSWFCFRSHENFVTEHNKN